MKLYKNKIIRGSIDQFSKIVILAKLLKCKFISNELQEYGKTSPRRCQDGRNVVFILSND